MRTKQALTGIVEHARGWTKAWAAGFTDKEARDRAGGPVNPLAWQLGHIACTQDDVLRLFGTGRGITPDSLRAICGNGSPPPTQKTVYPSQKKLWALLDKTQARLIRLVKSSTDKGFDRPPREPSDFFQSLGQAAYEISLHELYHCGAIAALRKAHRKPSMG
jgi:DinB family protein